MVSPEAFPKPTECSQLTFIPHSYPPSSNLFSRSRSPPHSPFLEKSLFQLSPDNQLLNSPNKLLTCMSSRSHRRRGRLSSPETLPLPLTVYEDFESRRSAIWNSHSQFPTPLTVTLQTDDPIPPKLVPNPEFVGRRSRKKTSVIDDFDGEKNALWIDAIARGLEDDSFSDFLAKLPDCPNCDFLISEESSDLIETEMKGPLEETAFDLNVTDSDPVVVRPMSVSEVNEDWGFRDQRIGRYIHMCLRPVVTTRRRVR
jgi:hypothetical protein